MSRFAVTGDLKGISKQQIEGICNALEDFKQDIESITIEPLGKAGDNFASDVKLLKVNTKRTETINVIVKISPNYDSQNAMSFLTGIFFNNEITIYSQILPMMLHIQEASGVKDNEFYKYPECLGFGREPGHEFILLEDLSKDNYVMMDKMTPLTNETVKLVLRDIAKFHSLSYALRDSAPDMFSEFTKKLIDMNANEKLAEQQKGLSVVGENLSHMFDKQKHKTVVKESFRDHSANISKLIESDTGSKYTVILHGDAWTNNMLFKLKDNQPTDCVFIDYQLARESLPVADLLYFLFNCTDYQTRAQHYYEWLDYYHSQLDKNLFNFGLKVSNVYPRDKFDSDLRRYAKAYLGFAMLTCSILLRHRDEAAVVKEAMVDAKTEEHLKDFLKVSNLQKETLGKIKDRIEGLIDSCYDFGYLNVS